MAFSNLLADLISDFNKPKIVWQAGIIAACALIGWLLARVVRGAYADPNGRTMVHLGVSSFGDVLSPAFIAGLIAGSQWFAKPYIGNAHLLKAALPVFGSLAVIRLAFYLLRGPVARRGAVGAALVTFEKIFAMLVWFGVALYLTGLWVDVVDFLDNTTLPLGKNKVALSTILQAAVSVGVLLMVAMWAGAAIESRLMGMAGLHTSLRVVMARMSKGVLIVVAVLVSLSLVGIDLTVLSVFGGALGVGLGLGMQKIASNYVSGFVILIERSLTIGDMISVDKYTGKVTRINTRYTVLQGQDGVETVLPNEMLISGAVQNQSLSHSTVQLSTTLTVASDCDLDAVLALLESVPRGMPRVLEQPAPSVTIKKLSAAGHELELGFWIGDPNNGRGSVVSEVNKAIYGLIRAGRITLA
ncbi:mechanosensitive ion channel [Massilia sp. PAMC28688]|uniref:mechanosensitive ion channel family protein n=1 Tax=Massilia sp. PAMC28688 TaxID=2861283 RepID=UPI001C628758|nr:mechanosensitive ion channel domain-containing protein [Massilia sp. PAMC28688]QYF91910.1 mechanosensitive ion channel [Massilia sp. PAMC28688]